VDLHKVCYEHNDPLIHLGSDAADVISLQRNWYHGTREIIVYFSFHFGVVYTLVLYYK
jgi:hypothetical protein